MCIGLLFYTSFLRIALVMYLNNAVSIAVGDEFDGFVDENYERELISESMLPHCGFELYF